MLKFNNDSEWETWNTMDDFLCSPLCSLSARPLLRREALPLSLSLSLCLSLFGSVENERWRILGSTEVKRWILPSIFKFRIERRQTKGTNATNEKGETEAHGSRTLLPWLWSFLVITFFQFEGRTEESVATFPAIAHSPPPKKKNLLSFLRFPSSSRRFLLYFSFIQFFLIKILIVELS